MHLRAGFVISISLQLFGFGNALHLFLLIKNPGLHCLQCVFPDSMIIVLPCSQSFTGSTHPLSVHSFGYEQALSNEH